MAWFKQDLSVFGAKKGPIFRGKRQSVKFQGCILGIDLKLQIPDTLNVWYIYIHSPQELTIHVCKYKSTIHSVFENMFMFFFAEAHLDKRCMFLSI